MAIAETRIETTKAKLPFSIRARQYLQCLLEKIPTQCILCRKTTYAPTSLCQGCAKELPVPQNSCSCCGEEQPHNSNALLCSRCLTQPPPYFLCRAALLYQSPVNRLIASFKYSARFETGKVLSCLLTEQFLQHYNRLDTGFPTALIPVPLHPKRLRQRGFNQAQEVCKVLARRSRVQVHNGLLVRHRHTQPQSKAASTGARRKNLRGAFRVNSVSSTLPAHIALIDDVVTTGSTVAEAALTLKRAGVQRVDVWCLARANR